MANERFTPGPWEVAAWHTPDNMKKHFPETDGQDLMIKIRQVNGPLIGNTFGWISKRPQAEANAALIAAAPAMYEALKAAKEMVDKMCDEYLKMVGADSTAFDNITFMEIETALAAANPETKS